MPPRAASVCAHGIVKFVSGAANKWPEHGQTMRFGSKLVLTPLTLMIAKILIADQMLHFEEFLGTTVPLYLLRRHLERPGSSDNAHCGSYSVREELRLIAENLGVLAKTICPK